MSASTPSSRSSPNGNGSDALHPDGVGTAQAPEPIGEELEGDVTKLLRHLDSADGLAKGVECRLDSLLGSLDSLLAVLETGGNTIMSHPVESNETSAGGREAPLVEQSTQQGQ